MIYINGCILQMILVLELLFDALKNCLKTLLVRNFYIVSLTLPWIIFVKYHMPVFEYTVHYVTYCFSDTVYPFIFIYSIFIVHVSLLG